MLHMIKNTLAITLIVTLLAACAGKTANPVMVAQYGDEQKNCKALEYELTSI